jgi:hypothetical protein
MFLPSSIREKAYRIVDKYGIFLAGIVIFGYYLWTAIDLFTGSNQRFSFQGYLFRFDSVVMLWLLLYVAVKLFEHKKRQKREQEENRRRLFEYEWQKRQLEMLDEVTTIVSDSINNPLAIISVSTSSIRQKFTTDPEILAFLDSIDGALKRMNEVLHGFQNYQTKKILKSAPPPDASEDVAARGGQTSVKGKRPSVSPTGEIHSP